MNNVNILVVLLITTYLTTGCKKDVPVDPTESNEPISTTHLPGNFLCSIEQQSNYSDGSSGSSSDGKNYQSVEKMAVISGSLVFMSWSFPITTQNQITFTDGTGTLVFGTDYESFTFERYSSSSSEFSSSSSHWTVSGTRTTLPSTEDISNPHAQFNGTYLLTREKSGDLWSDPGLQIYPATDTFELIFADQQVFLNNAVITPFFLPDFYMNYESEEYYAGVTTECVYEMDSTTIYLHKYIDDWGGGYELTFSGIKL